MKFAFIVTGSMFLQSYCVSDNVRISASEKDLPVPDTVVPCNFGRGTHNNVDCDVHYLIADLHSCCYHKMSNYCLVW